MSLKAQTHFNTIHNVCVITPHGATQQFGMLIFVHEKTSASLPGHLTCLPCLLSHLNWLPHPHLILSNAWHAYTLAPPSHFRPHHSLWFLTPSSSSPWLTILTLLQGPQVMPPTPPSPPLTPPCTHLILSAAYHPYIGGVPSQHATDTAYNPYTCIVPAQHSSNAAYHPYTWSALPTCLKRPLTLAQSSRPLMILTLLQPPQDDTMMPPPISALTTPYASTPSPYHPYAPTARSRYASDATLNPPYA
ncbi:hypothetical protein O181_079092 [Austropuccinia psidii MF-1]|uniref:Uncharacterized protein n=1 Tax=Austropuccinia psidii MF-1 TaxID=1389203 RepID=A0A9Q3FJ11_9BASI|nr:hypothetical protein [Austropuccinia psidii MF-1]